MQKNKTPPLAKLSRRVREIIGALPITPPIWPRRFFHLLVGSTIPVSALYLPDALFIWSLVTLSVVAVLTEAGRTMTPKINDLIVRCLPFFKPAERHIVTGATFMLLAATAAFVLFDKHIAILAMVFLAVGDPFAALVGYRARHGRIFGKSLAGTAAFTISAGIAGTLFTLHPSIPMAWWFFPGLVTAGAVEILPIPLDDNVTVPLAGGGIMALLALA
jgi:glycerol-3-phosphate acyltransferase PlsY